MQSRSSDLWLAESLLASGKDAGWRKRALPFYTGAFLSPIPFTILAAYIMAPSSGHHVSNERAALSDGSCRQKCLTAGQAVATSSPSSLRGFAYVPRSVKPGGRTFCVDARGFVCYTPAPAGVMPDPVDGLCPAECKRLN